MPKLKSHRGAQKRFRTTASGAIKRRRAYRNHILTKKTSKQKRQFICDSQCNALSVTLVCSHSLMLPLRSLSAVTFAGVQSCSSPPQHGRVELQFPFRLSPCRVPSRKKKHTIPRRESTPLNTLKRVGDAMESARAGTHIHNTPRSAHNDTRYRTTKFG